MKIKRLLLLFSLPLSLAVCVSYKNMPYLQNLKAMNNFGEVLPLCDAEIIPKDLLNITASTTGPQAAAPSNLTVQAPLNAALTNINTTTQPTLQQYLMNNSGEIDFLVTDTLRTGDLTKNGTESLIREGLRSYLKRAPIVTVHMANYRISTLGEVTRPGSFTIDSREMNVPEALTMTGDITIYGVHDNVKSIREDKGGRREIINLDLNNVGIMTSPYYYLKQNGILYVTPNEMKVKSSDTGSNTTSWVNSISILVPVAGLLVNILK